jgi:hypothetical protein
MCGDLSMGQPGPFQDPYMVKDYFTVGTSACMHALKFQMVMSPYGIMAHLFGPLEGRRHDAAMLQESGLLSQVEQHMTRGSTTSSGNYWVSCMVIQHISQPPTDSATVSRSTFVSF